MPGVPLAVQPWPPLLGSGFRGTQLVSRWGWGTHSAPAPHRVQGRALVFMVEMMATASVDASMETNRPQYCHVHPLACRLKTYSMMGIIRPTLAMTTMKASVSTCTTCCAGHRARQPGAGAAAGYIRVQVRMVTEAGLEPASSLDP